jgi:hypothetical protein
MSLLNGALNVTAAVLLVPVSVPAKVPTNDTDPAVGPVWKMFRVKFPVRVPVGFAMVPVVLNCPKATWEGGGTLTVLLRELVKVIKIPGAVKTGVFGVVPPENEPVVKNDTKSACALDPSVSPPPNTNAMQRNRTILMGYSSCLWCNPSQCGEPQQGRRTTMRRGFIRRLAASVQRSGD